MDSKQKLALRIAGYLAFFVVFFLLMLYLLFPFNRWKGTLQEILSRELGRRVTVGSVHGWGVTGLKLQDVRIEEPEPDEEGGARGRRTPAGSRKKAGRRSEPRNPPLTVDELGLRYSLFAALRGKMGVCFDVRIYDGFIKGCYVDGARTPAGEPKQIESGKAPPRSTIDLKVRRIDLTRVERLTSLLGLPFFGTAEADVDIEYPAGDPGDVGGEVEVRLEDLRIGEPGGKLDLEKTWGGMLSGDVSFEPIEVGDLEMVLTGREGRLVVEKLGSSSRHVEIRGAGDIVMREPLLSSGLNIYLMFKFLPAYINQSAMTKTIFSTLDRLPQMRKAKRPDGYFGFLLKGDLRTGPKPLPSRSGPSSAEKAGAGAEQSGKRPSGLPMGVKAGPHED